MQPFRETLVDLLELQKIDSAIDRLEYRRLNLPEQAELDSLSARLSVLQRALGEHQMRADDAASRQRRLDAEIDSVSRKIEAEESRLYAGKVSSPKELSALQAEIEYLKKRKSGVEEDDLEVMEEREEIDAALDVLQKEEEELRSAVDAQTQRRDEAVGQVVSEIESTRKEREARAQKFDAGLLQMYDDLRAAKAGVAIAALVDGTCQGCHMKLPAQEVAQLRRSEGAAKCVECGRLLVVG